MKKELCKCRHFYKDHIQGVGLTYARCLVGKCKCNDYDEIVCVCGHTKEDHGGDYCCCAKFSAAKKPKKYPKYH